ncbi:hypothetical protein Cni_G03484 [Canna indica]|uniref:Uncharacterized protein n=1 Tax=Canna indica TaxID=4628 RepID=A0AAQ3Q3F8_9LILI|nr:hypothetical protein Cni_G03484 [Canna indica]
MEKKRKENKCSRRKAESKGKIKASRMFIRSLQTADGEWNRHTQKKYKDAKEAPTVRGEHNRQKKRKKTESSLEPCRKESLRTSCRFLPAKPQSSYRLSRPLLLSRPPTSSTAVPPPPIWEEEKEMPSPGRKKRKYQALRFSKT